MALIQAHFYSKVLNMQRTMNVILPQQKNGVGTASQETGNKWPVLYLLHGGSDDHTTWQRQTSIERYALEHGIAVVLASTDLGFYTDMKYGYRFFEHFSEELPQIVAEFFPGLSTKRESTFVAGQSMGGFGAIKLALFCPERFAAAASLSGMLDPVTRYETRETTYFNENYLPIYGDTVEEVCESVNDLPYQMEKALEEGRELPKLYMCCGTEDYLYDINRKFIDRFGKRANITYYEEPGSHEWGFWDRNIQRVLDWLPIPKEVR